MQKIKCLILASITLALSACSTLPKTDESSTAAEAKAEADTSYQFDMPLEVNGLKGTGGIVVPQAPRYDIKARAPTNPEMVTVSTCQREEILGKQDDKFSITLTPNSYESAPGGYCPLKITALGQKFRYAGGMVVVRGVKDTLPVTMTCNGPTTKEVGAVWCESRSSIPQYLTFENPVFVGVSKTVGCPVPEDLGGGKSFRIRLAPLLCSYTFGEKEGLKRFLQGTFHGYDRYRMGLK